jgi:hypothetical protein
MQKRIPQINASPYYNSKRGHSKKSYLRKGVAITTQPDTINAHADSIMLKANIMEE